MQYDIDELLQWKSPVSEQDTISHGIMLPETRVMLFGPGKTWKTGTALHLSWCLALGKSWFGFKTTKSVVLYFQAELPQAAFRKRVLKFRNGSDEVFPKNILFETIDRAKINTQYGMKLLGDSMSRAHSRFPDLPLVVVLDPVYKLIKGDINSSQDMIPFVDSIDELKAKNSAGVILVHHARQTVRDNKGAAVDCGSEESLGTSIWVDWVDTMIKLKLLNPPPLLANKVLLQFVLHRHAEDLLPSITLLWNKNTLHPMVVSIDMQEQYVVEQASIRNLTEDSLQHTMIDIS